ncbi:MAG: 30S ribosomal protein S20 [Planctomycetota bacterium]
MPNSASAKKRLRQNEARRLRNRSARAAVRTQVKKVRAAVKEGDAAKGDAELRTAAKQLDRAASKGLIHANAAARTKSRLSKALKELKASAS